MSPVLKLRRTAFVTWGAAFAPLFMAVIGCGLLTSAHGQTDYQAIKKLRRIV